MIRVGQMGRLMQMRVTPPKTSQLFLHVRAPPLAICSFCSFSYLIFTFANTLQMIKPMSTG